VEPDDRSAFLLAEAKRRDPDRYLCILFAPAERRDDLLALVLFNDELARIPGAVTQPMTGMIRLQWWRDALDELLTGQPPRRHPTVEALAPLLAAGRAAPNTLHALIDAREPALEPPIPDVRWLEGYAMATGGELARAWYTALGGNSAPAASAAATIGTAHALVGLERALRLEEAERHDAAGMDRLQALSTDLRRRADELNAEGRKQAGRPPKEVMAAFLPASLVAGRRPLTPLTMAARVWLRRP
jgi:NADH dehydrogenase [ubiquinone] 1 alpha subcomplex assembly factor 6